ncbi:MAG: dihydropteroate synthase, partial [Candidatus Omnitrophica bacterium]|nr:dihydropteroate synthase [Candidatus Omnitrophota bacterium]
MFKARGFSLALGPKTLVMGIVNVTPDSFSGDGTLKNQDAFRRTLQHLKNGANLIDIGGESSRPGAKTMTADEEIRRIVPLIKKLAKVVKGPISVDTYKGLTAEHALDAGASIINNIQGVKSEKNLLKMVARYKAGIILMHMRGTPKTMQKKTKYKNLIAD